MARTTPILGAIGAAAALSFASPAAAAELPSAPANNLQNLSFTGFSSSSYDPEADTAEWRRRCGWRRCGWRRGWRGRRGIGVGGVLAGAAIIGGIAAIASSNNRRRDREVVVVERDRRDDDRRFDDRRDNPRASNGSGIDNAVSQCLREIERDVRVDSVDGASRVASGWLVSGTIFDGSGFTCEIGNNGRISDISYGRFRGSSADFPRDSRAAGQWSDDRYASARASIDAPSGEQRFAEAGERPAQPLVPLTADRLPAYPGGPVPD
jgi:hypothetical protein